LDDDLPVAPRESAPGADLSRLSVGEIEERITALKAEIVRLEETLAKKTASRAAAEAAFRLGG